MMNTQVSWVDAGDGWIEIYIDDEFHSTITRDALWDIFKDTYTTCDWRMANAQSEQG